MRQQILIQDAIGRTIEGVLLDRLGSHLCIALSGDAFACIEADDFDDDPVLDLGMVSPLYASYEKEKLEELLGKETSDELLEAHRLYREEMKRQQKLDDERRDQQEYLRLKAKFESKEQSDGTA